MVALAATPVAGAENAFRLELTQPRVATYGDAVALRGRVVPALIDAPITITRDGAVVGTATTRADGTFVLRTRAERPAVYTASAGSLTSAPVSLAVRPKLSLRMVGSGVVGTPLRVEVSVQPAFPVRVVVRRNGRVVATRSFVGTGRIGLSTRRAASYRVSATVEAPPGWAGATRALASSAVHPRLALGSRGPSVRVLEARLRELRYALQRVDGLYGLDTHQAVLAFQKVNRLPWTGRVDARVWRALARASVPRARYAGDHIEVSKGRQFLFLVRDGDVERVVHVSTGATGNTPLGTWRVYRKVTGWDWVLWYPMYFLRGFAIHGYPEVPAYPASHGCVRVPMWAATRLFAMHPYRYAIWIYN
jgi:lipoprotein-anchoring transpeptidase ErfK/SrfK